MKVLILTQYFPPETGAPQNRLYSLAKHLSTFGIKVSILTAMPNYPGMVIMPKYKGRFYAKENEGLLTIHRTYIYVSTKKGVITRLLNYFSFVLSSSLAGLTKVGHQDVIICESPPLFLGLTALFLKKFKKAKLVFNVSDLWPESVERLGIIKSKFLLRIAYGIEKTIYRNSALVSGQTQGILKSINARFPDVQTFWYRNGIDYGQFNVNIDGIDFRKKNSLTLNHFVLLYAGILGHAQGLETVLDAAELLKEHSDIRFIIVGDGPKKDKLVAIAKKKNLQNVTFIPNRPQAEIPNIIAGCDVFLVPLKKLDLFNGAIPSKIFEPLAMGKPIILGVNGEARRLFIEEGKTGLYYEPENCKELADCINKLYINKKLVSELGEAGRKYVNLNFNRAEIARDFHQELKNLN